MVGTKMVLAFVTNYVLLAVIQMVHVNKMKPASMAGIKMDPVHAQQFVPVNAMKQARVKNQKNVHVQMKNTVRKMKTANAKDVQMIPGIRMARVKIVRMVGTKMVLANVLTTVLPVVSGTESVNN